MLTLSNRSFILLTVVFFVLMVGGSLLYLQHVESDTPQGEHVHAEPPATPSPPSESPSDEDPFSALCRGGCGTVFASNYNAPAQDLSHKIRCGEDLKGEGFEVWIHHVVFGCAYTYYNCTGQTCPNAEKHK